MNNSTVSNVTQRHATQGLIDVWNTLLLIYAIINCIIAPIIIFGNIAVIASILYKRDLRCTFFHLSIVSIAACDLIAGIFIAPLAADVGFRHDYVHGCVVRIILTVFDSYVHRFVSMWPIVAMNTDYLLKMCYIRTPLLTPLFRKLLFGVVLSLPWIAMLMIVLPVAYVKSRIVSTVIYCRIYVQGNAKILVTSLSYFVPAILILIQVVIMTAVKVYRRKHATRIPATASICNIPSPWVLVAASTVTVVLFIEELFDSFPDITRGLNLIVYVCVRIVALLFADLKSAVLPFVWFFYSDIRASLRELFNKLPCRRTVDVLKSDFKVRYKKFSDEDPEASVQCT